MVAIKSILEEELGRLREAAQSYEKQLQSLPKGSIQQKRIKGKFYPYLVFRKGKRVISQYLGRSGKKELERLQASILSRRKQEATLLQVQRNISQIKQMLYGRKRSV